MHQAPHIITHFTCTKIHEGGTITIAIVQMQKLRHKEVKYLAQVIRQYHF